MMLVGRPGVDVNEKEQAGDLFPDSESTDLALDSLEAISAKLKMLLASLEEDRAEIQRTQEISEEVLSLEFRI